MGRLDIFERRSDRLSNREFWPGKCYVGRRSDHGGSRIDGLYFLNDYFLDEALVYGGRGVWGIGERPAVGLHGGLVDPSILEGAKVDASEQPGAPTERSDRLRRASVADTTLHPRGQGVRDGMAARRVGRRTVFSLTWLA